MQSEKEALEAQVKTAEGRVDALSSNLANYKTSYGKLVEQSKNNLGNLNGQIAQHKAEIATLTSERDALRKQLAESGASGGVELVALQEKLAKMEAEKTKLEGEKNALEQKLATTPAAPAATGNGDADTVR